MGTRNTYIDFVKGLCLICVFLGHSGVDLGVITHLWQTFFMSAFFFFSGYHFKEYSIKEAIKRDFKKLLLVYFIWAVGVLLGVMAFEYLAFHIYPPSHEYLVLLKDTILGKDQHGFVSQLWFLYALFSVRLMWGIALSLFKTDRGKFIFVGITCFLGIILNLMNFKGSPFRAVTAMIILPVFVCGIYAGKDRVLDDSFSASFSPYLNWWQFVALAFIWVFGSWLNFRLYGRSVSLWGEVYNFYPLFYLNALAGILVFLNVARMLEMSRWKVLDAVDSFFRFFGKNSFPAFVSMNICIEVAARIVRHMGTENNWAVCLLAVLLEVPTIWLLKQKPFKWLLAQ